MSKAILIPEGNKDIGKMKDKMSLSPVEKKEGATGIFRLLRFDSLSKKSAPSSPTTTGPPITYYGVYIPYGIMEEAEEKKITVYKNKSEALDLVRKYKLGRFKAFTDYNDALSFAMRGTDPTDVPDSNGNSLMGEKPYPFKAPSPQDMVALRKSIEAGLVSKVTDRVWDNPRFLVSSGNTPAIMHEGSRYNAMHVAAKSMNAEMCNQILNIVGDPVFVQTLYGTDTDEECCKEFASILLDRYLNTPDKGMNETPLHFACKFGAADVVDVLTSFPQCNVDAVNKHGQRPRDIICFRVAKPEKDTVDRISKLLSTRYYVPVLHCADESGPPAVGGVFTPSSHPDLNKDPLSPQYEIRAFAGPMEECDAEVFRRKWKTPPRNPKGRVAPPTFRLKEMSKGLESVGRNLADEMKVDWKEYWPFLDTFTDLRTKEGLTLLENYLKNKYEAACTLAYSDTNNESISPDDLTLSRISINASQLSPPKSKIMSPMTELCVAMNTCTINDKPVHWSRTDPIKQRLCRQPSAKHILNGDPSPQTNHSVSQQMCIERTCQVFAKRLADSLVFSLTAEPEIAGESLKSEAKRLQHTIQSYMDDQHFKDINFGLIHSRLAQLVVFKLKQQTKDLDDVNNLVEFLMKLRCPNDDIFSSDDERKSFGRVKKNNIIETHVRCLASYISEELLEEEVLKGPSVSENECTELWAKASKCSCEWKTEFDRGSKKLGSFRKNRSILSVYSKNDSLAKRLSFDLDIGDGRLQHVESEKPTSVNSPSGDGNQPSLFTVDMNKCQVVPAEISDDESAASDADSDAFHTASEHSDSDCDMQDASDRAAVEPFIYGEEPTKTDRLVWDAIQSCDITAEQYPNIYRWKHTVSLYSSSERDKWQPAIITDDSINSPMAYSFNLGQTLANAHRSRVRKSLRDIRNSPTLDRCSTPKKNDGGFNDSSGRGVSLQVSNWLRVTGPNSPKCVLAAKNVGHNLSFGL